MVTKVGEDLTASDRIHLSETGTVRRTTQQEHLLAHLGLLEVPDSRTVTEPLLVATRPCVSSVVVEQRHLGRLKVACLQLICEGKRVIGECKVSVVESLVH